MIKLKCKFDGACNGKKQEQKLEYCFNCRHLEKLDDLVLHTIDKQVEQLIEEKQKSLDELSPKELSILAEEQLKNPVKKSHIFGEGIPKRSDMTIEDIAAYPNIFEEQPQEQAMRFNEGKPQWSLVHFKSLEPMIRVLEFGALKYAPKNWMKPMDITKILESMQRHLVALFDGEEVDKESGISHMGHIMCNAMFYNYHKEKENESRQSTSRGE